MTKPVHVLAVLFALCAVACTFGCDRGSQGIAKPVSLALKQLPHPGSLAELEVPDSAVLLGLREEGLHVHVAFRLREEDLCKFLDQRVFQHLNEEATDTKFGEYIDADWWKPDSGRVMHRRNGMLPDVRALWLSVNSDSRKNYVVVYLYRFNV